MSRLTALFMPLAGALVFAPSAFAASNGSEPAGGAAIGEVIGATAGAVIATAIVFALGLGHRAGRTKLLARAADHASRISGLPPWAALPVDIASASLICALFGMYWDISLHIDQGRDPGPLANPAHYFILVGLFGIFAAGFLSICLPEEKPSRSAVRIAQGWYVPAGGIVLLLCSSFSLMGFPLDDIWHRLFGQDVTLWGPTHLMLIGGAGLALLGNMTLLVEAGATPGREKFRSDAVDNSRVLKFFVRTRYAAMVGGLLIGLSTFQAEFDFGVPQFRMIFQPALIAFAASVALVVARLYAGRGGAFIAVIYFWAIRGLVSVLVGPVLGETTPHLPLYFAEAAIVEGLAYVVSVKRPYLFGAVSGLLIGTLGTAAEWGWSHVWMPIPWPENLLDPALLTVPVTGLAGGVIGGFVGSALGGTRRGFSYGAPALAPAVAALLAVMAVVGFGLQTSAEKNVRATVALTDVKGGDQREVQAEVKVDPPQAADDAEWVTITAWQGGGLVLDRLERTGPGTYRTTKPIPVYDSWKTLVRVHRDDSIAGIPVYLPEDKAIPAKEVPADPRFTRTFVEDHKILQREQKGGVAKILPVIAYGTVLLIALGLIALLGWALRRVASSAAPERVEERGPTAEAEVRAAG